MTKFSVDQALTKAKILKKRGELIEAQRLIQSVLKSFPKNKRAQKELQTLTKKKQNNIYPSLVKQEVDHLLELYKQGQLLEVVEQAMVLSEQYPNQFMLWNLMGTASAQTGQFDRAAYAFKKALKIKPGTAEIYNNIGNVYFEQKKLGDAIEAYQKAISINPHFAEAFCNMGNCFIDKGNLEEALKAYSEALFIRPNYAEAFNNIGIALKGNVFDKPNSTIQQIIVTLLDQKIYVRPENIAGAGISLLKVEPNLKKHLHNCHFDYFKKNLLEVVAELNKYPLLLTLMSVCPIADLEFEKLFKNLRHALLSIVSISEPPAEILKFQNALALQCFTNEYVYEETTEEKVSVEILNQAVKNALNTKKQPRPEVILALASYRSLKEYTWNNLITVTDKIQDVFIRQVDEIIQEEKLKEKICRLGEISDQISFKVRQQYEESPYPRWVNLSLRLNPTSISGVVDEVNLKLFDSRILDQNAPNILVAGCGTGQHSIGTASRFKNSNVFAIDLSLSSLAYAKRKTKELGIKNIEYMQGDILNLGHLNKKFDIVESCGVLHHMDNPMAGWRALTNCLKPGGLMNIGLYSELAREDIVKVRDEICKQRVGSSMQEMKSFRSKLVESDKYHHKSIINISDFYTLSTLRDLLFHIQEHRFTIPQIKSCLQNLGLRFCGFEGSRIVSDFRLTNRNVDDIHDLEKWQAYEQANPSAFLGMYKFWCQKA